MKTVKLYTKNMCPYCDSAKRLFQKLAIPYEEINLENDPDERARVSEKAGGWRTMPMIWIGEQFLGGFEDVQKLHQRGELLPKVQ